LAVVASHATGLDIGRLAVLLFFYLSGYWTARIWSQRAGAGALRFYASRYLRVAPLYLVVMLAAAGLRHMPVQPPNLSLFGLASAPSDPTGVAWSLDIELQFYALVPVLVGLLPLLPTWAVMAVSLAIGVAGCWLDATHGVTTVAKYLPAFVLGSLTQVHAWRPTEREAYWSLAAFVEISALTVLTPFLKKITPDPFDRDIYAFFWMLPLLPYVARSLTIKSTPLDRHLGNLSYPLYLVHFPVMAVLSLPHPVEAALSIGVATVLYVTLDRPIDALRVRFIEAGQRPRAKAPVAMAAPAAVVGPGPVVVAASPSHPGDEWLLSRRATRPFEPKRSFADDGLHADYAAEAPLAEDAEAPLGRAQESAPR
jgi:peptidoglycan/LPS O-acetylase OafA/YrhL